MATDVLEPEVTFLDEQAARTYDCGICLNKLQNPVIVCDDHLFCNQCIQHVIQREGSTFRCPACRTKCKRSKIRRNKFIDRRMGELMVKCPNFEITPKKTIYLTRKNPFTKHQHQQRRTTHANQPQRQRSRSRSRSRASVRTDSEDAELQSFINEDSHRDEKEQDRDDEMQLCSWMGPWNKLKEHIDECPLDVIHCKHWFGHLIMRKDTEQHYKSCSYYPIKCSHCNRKLPRYMINMHENFYCGERPVACKYKEFGCSGLVKRKNYYQHMKFCASLHLEMVVKEHNKLKDSVHGLKQEMNALKENMNQKLLEISAPKD